MVTVYYGNELSLVSKFNLNLMLMFKLANYKYGNLYMLLKSLFLNTQCTWEIKK